MDKVDGRGTDQWTSVTDVWDEPYQRREDSTRSRDEWDGTGVAGEPVEGRRYLRGLRKIET